MCGGRRLLEATEWSCAVFVFMVIIHVIAVVLVRWTYNCDLVMLHTNPRMEICILSSKYGQVHTEPVTKHPAEPSIYYFYGSPDMTNREDTTATVPVTVVVSKINHDTIRVLDGSVINVSAAVKSLLYSDPTGPDVYFYFSNHLPPMYYDDDDENDVMRRAYAKGYGSRFSMEYTALRDETLYFGTERVSVLDIGHIGTWTFEINTPVPKLEEFQKCERPKCKIYDEGDDPDDVLLPGWGVRTAVVAVASDTGSGDTDSLMKVRLGLRAKTIRAWSLSTGIICVVSFVVALVFLILTAICRYQKGSFDDD